MLSSPEIRSGCGWRRRRLAHRRQLFAQPAGIYTRAITQRRKALALPLTAIVLACAVLAAGCGKDYKVGAVKAAIGGTWKGTLNGSGNENFRAVVEINTLRVGSVSGTVYFPGIGGSGACSGALIYKGRSGSDYLFTEDLVARANPECIKLGKVRISPEDDGWAIKYVWTAGKNTAEGTLK